MISFSLRISSNPHKNARKYNIRRKNFRHIPLVKLEVDEYKNERLALIYV